MINRLRACRSDELREGAYLKLEVIFSGEPASLILVRFQERCFAYLNRCVHMARPLDGEEDAILDHTGKYLRCSMHGIVFDPVTGESMSTLCRGERLTAVKVSENDGAIWIKDRRIGERPV
ncbi:Rieske (2Fe-2S) protein [Thiocystis violacea]|uniref:Rieske (2Fe-2S) protein n=1 Tax=Thiocystis violacea TaxID=13725 RepID=UPI001907E6C3|nr:Rieske 2Fe-2S domain-containing protein [Thiocystis violacea]MBK1719325.1 (2Fe-2S)-binding protein [Thiocystis violacea]